MRSTYGRSLWRRFGAVLTAAIVLSGCANLDAVRNFAQSSSALTSYPDAGAAYVESGRQWTLLPAPAPLPDGRKPVTLEERQQQVSASLKLQSALSSYFAVMAKLAGADAFTLDNELTSVASGLKGLPGQADNAAMIDTANNLLKLAVKYALMPVQQSSVRALVSEGGPPAMSLVDHLDRLAGDWQSQMVQDDTSMKNFLSLMAATKDANKSVEFLLSDRSQQFTVHAGTRQQRVASVRAGLKTIKSGHEAMVRDIDRLDGSQLQALLKQAVADLKQVRGLLDSLR
ncbi:MAG: hypothetical protein ACK54C_02380 [Betaproteobacteria bacterium]